MATKNRLHNWSGWCRDVEHMLGGSAEEERAYMRDLGRRMFADVFGFDVEETIEAMQMVIEEMNDESYDEDAGDGDGDEMDDGESISEQSMGRDNRGLRPERPSDVPRATGVGREVQGRDHGAVSDPVPVAPAAGPLKPRGVMPGRLDKRRGT